MQKAMNNCEKCHARYAPYKVGADEDMGAFWCEIPVIDEETGKVKIPHGLCQFHNPKSRLYIDELSPSLSYGKHLTHDTI